VFGHLDLAPIGSMSDFFVHSSNLIAQHLHSLHVRMECIGSNNRNHLYRDPNHNAKATVVHNNNSTVPLRHLKSALGLCTDNSSRNHFVHNPNCSKIPCQVGLDTEPVVQGIVEVGLGTELVVQGIVEVGLDTEPVVQGIVEVGLDTEPVVDGRARVDGMLSELERSIPILMQLLEPLNPKAKLSLK